MNPIFTVRRAGNFYCYLPILLAGLFLVQPARGVDPATLVLIHSRGQTFSMGQSLGGKVWTQTTPVHDVRFTYDFLMRATLISQGQYLEFNHRTNPSSHVITGDLNLPVEQVSWQEAIAYCNDLSAREGLTPAYSADGTADLSKNGYRLLTAAENEFVTRQRTTTLLFYGDTYDNFGLLFGWSDGPSNRKSAAGNSAGVTHDVGTLRPDAYGVYDMVGNLWEWCHDCYDTASSNNYPSTLQIDPTGPAAGAERIAKGGAFWNDGGHHEMSANHWQWKPDSKSSEIGFRICRTVLPSENLAYSNVLTAPANLGMVSGKIACSANVVRGGGIAVAGVQFRVDGINLGPEVVRPPYSISWDTTTMVNGSHTLSVVARDATGLLTSEFENVTVINAGPPKLLIVNQPQNMPATVGQPVTFSVDAAGLPLPAYQWRKNGEDITNAMATSYTTLPVTAADNGAVFSVVATNSWGTITSSNATLLVR